MIVATGGPVVAHIGTMVAEGADAHGLGHLGGGFQRADGAAGARVQQVHRQHGTEENRDPDREIDRAGIEHFHLARKDHLHTNFIFPVLI